MPEENYEKGQRNAKGQLVCGAKTRRGTPCQQTILGPSGRCRMHGGASPRGLAHPSYRHGRYSKYLPRRLEDRYALTVTDPEILNLSHEIALVDARIMDVLERVDSGESGRLWRNLGRLRSDFLSALRAEDQESQADAVREIMNLIGRGQADHAAWSEIVDLLERRRRLVDSEQRRRVQMHSLVKVEEAKFAMFDVADSVRDACVEHIADHDIRRRVLEDVQSALARHLGPGLLASPERGN